MQDNQMSVEITGFPQQYYKYKQNTYFTHHSQHSYYRLPLLPSERKQHFKEKLP